MTFSPIPEILDELKTGRMVVLVDDASRENEGDLVLAAEKTTPEAINFMARSGRGLICLALSPEKVDALRLVPMTAQNESRFGTGLTASCVAGACSVVTNCSSGGPPGVAAHPATINASPVRP